MEVNIFRSSGVNPLIFPAHNAMRIRRFVDVSSVDNSGAKNSIFSILSSVKIDIDWKWKLSHLNCHFFLKMVLSDVFVPWMIHPTQG